MRRKKIGTMDFHGSVDITDPCYNRDVWCRMTDVKIRNGSSVGIKSFPIEATQTPHRPNESRSL